MTTSWTINFRPTVTQNPHSISSLSQRRYVRQFHLGLMESLQVRLFSTVLTVIGKRGDMSYAYRHRMLLMPQCSR
jgi:hypothetical protein